MATPSELEEHALQETQIPPPRSLKLRRLGENWGMWTRNTYSAVILLVVLGVLFYQGLLPILAKQFGRPAQAEITDMNVNHGKGTTYQVQLAYEAGTEMLSAEVPVGYGLFSNWRIGQKVGIHYLSLFPGAPSLDDSAINRLDAFVSVSFLLVVAISVGFTPSRIARQKMLLIQGRSAKGKVEAADRRRLKARFEYEGKEYVSTGPGFYYGGQKIQGDTVVVLFDPDNPKKNMIYDPANSLWAPVADPF